MILNHIHHKMPIYKDCTLAELIAVSSAYLLLGGSVFALLCKLILGYAMLGWALTILTLVPITRLLLSQLQKLKYGKPYGYYQQWFLKQLAQHFLLQNLVKIPYLQRCGCWSVRRSA